MVEVNTPVAPVVSEEPIAPEPSSSGWVRPMVAIAAFVVILTLVSSGAVLWLGGSSQLTYAAGTPEAALQDFVNAAQKGDWTTADRLLSSNLKSQGMASQSVAGLAGQSGVTVSIDSEYRNGSRATLSVSYQSDSSAGLNSPNYVAGSSVDMVLEADGWKVDSPLYYGY